MIPPIPRETARAAKAIFGRNNFYILAGENLESILGDMKLECGSDAWTGEVVLPSVTFFQFLEGLTDAQAIDAVRTRIDWKFALHLPVFPPTLRESALCEFREKILMDPSCQREYQTLIDRLITFNPPLNNRSQDFMNQELVSTVCSVNRLGLIHEAICQTLEVLACRFPVWLRKIARPHWYGRYSQTAPGFDSAASLRQQELSIQEIDTDIHYLLEEVRRSGSPEVKELQEIKALEHIWRRQFDKSDQVLNDKCKFLKLNECDYCIQKERRTPGGKYH
jgi:transposase